MLQKRNSTESLQKKIGAIFLCQLGGLSFAKRQILLRIVPTKIFVARVLNYYILQLFCSVHTIFLKRGIVVCASFAPKIFSLLLCGVAWVRITDDVKEALLSFEFNATSLKNALIIISYPDLHENDFELTHPEYCSCEHN